MHAHLHYIFRKLLGTKILLSFHSSLVHNRGRGGPLGGVFFALIHFRAFRLIAATHPTCVFPSLAYDTHIVGPTLDVFFFAIIRGV
jgi:hypothetical protein